MLGAGDGSFRSKGTESRLYERSLIHLLWEFLMGNLKNAVENSLEAGAGVLHLTPTWVPRAFAVPGGRIGLSNFDLYAYGPARGGIDERWLASTTQPDNGKNMAKDEGLSQVLSPDGDRFLLRDAIAEAGAAIVGKTIMDNYGRWPTLGKLFDNVGPLPFHLHPRTEHAKLVEEEPKPEAYYFPPQYNQFGHSFPHTFFGLEPGTTKAQVREALERWNSGDNGILFLSKAYRIKNGAGWASPAGVLHAPGSSVTYEIQWGTDTFAMFQSMVDGVSIPWEMVVKNVPQDKKLDLDFIVDLIDWEANTTPNFKERFSRDPINDAGSASGHDFSDSWVVYGSVNDMDAFSAKELTIQPGGSVTLHDSAASGVLVVQGQGTIGPFTAAAAGYVRFGELTNDEFFVSESAALDGVYLENRGVGPMVVLRHFGPGSQILG